MSQKRIGIIGAGISGLATAALLSRAGHSVTVLEGSDWIGGKSRRIHIDSQRMDTGPALVTFPGVWEEFIRRYNALKPDAASAQEIAPLEFELLDEVGEYFFAGQRCLLPVEKDHEWYPGWERFENIHGNLAKEITNLLTHSSLDPRAIPAVSALVSKYGPRLTTAEYLKGLSWLPEGLREVIAIHTLNAGVPPENTLALFATMPAVMASQGVRVPVGGVNEIPLALEKLAKAAGAEIHLNEKVLSIAKTSVRTKKASYGFDVVISSLDAARTDELIGKKRSTTPKARSCSGVAIYAVIKEDLPADTKTHSVIMPDDPAQLHSALTKQQIPDQSMVFVNYYRAGHIYPNTRSTVAVLLTAPADGNNYNLESDWVRKELKRVSQVMKLPKAIEDYFDGYKILDPEYFSTWGARGGALYGEARQIWQSGPLHTPKQRSLRRPWLWRVGASTHPGGGIPAVLGGSLIATERLLKSL